MYRSPKSAYQRVRQTRGRWYFAWECIEAIRPYEIRFEEGGELEEVGKPGKGGKLGKWGELEKHGGLEEWGKPPGHFDRQAMVCACEVLHIANVDGMDQTSMDAWKLFLHFFIADNARKRFSARQEGIHVQGGAGTRTTDNMQHLTHSLTHSLSHYQNATGV